MSARLLPAPRRAALIFREHGRGFAALVALTAVLYGLYASLRDSVDDWMAVAPTLVVALVPIVVVGSFRQSVAGGAALWLQKPVDPMRFHLARLLEVAFVAVVASVLFRCAAVAVGLAAGWEPDAHPLQALPGDGLTAVLVVIAGFGLSSWFGDHGRLATAAYLALSLFFQLLLVQAEVPQGAWPRLVRAAFFPASASAKVRAVLAGAADVDWQALAWLLAYCAAWLAVGIAGVRRTAESRAA